MDYICIALLDYMATKVQVPSTHRAKPPKAALALSLSEPLLPTTSGVDAHDGQGDAPPWTNPVHQNDSNDYQLLPIWVAVLFFLGCLVCLLGPVTIGGSLAWTDADPLGLAFLVSLYPFMLFYSVITGGIVVRSLLGLDSLPLYYPCPYEICHY